MHNSCLSTSTDLNTVQGLLSYKVNGNIVAVHSIKSVLPKSYSVKYYLRNFGFVLLPCTKITIYSGTGIMIKQ